MPEISKKNLELEIINRRADKIPAPMALFNELPTPRSINEHWATTVKWEGFTQGTRSVCCYDRKLAIWLAWLSWKSGEIYSLEGDTLKYKPKGWPESR